jgi:two-component system LytT family response regulator
MTIERPIRVLIVDDEPLARNKLQLLLGRDPEIEIAGEAENAQRAIELIAMLRPDVLFLDVQMPDRDGFEVLNQIPPEMMPAVIFTTAFDMYAIRSFEAQALDYLLKPFDEERFAKVLMRAKSHRARTIAARTESGTEAPSAAATAERFVIKTGGRIIFLNSTDIDWFQAEANYVRLHAGGASYSIRGTIGATESKLDRQSFVRIHRSVIVNVERIREIRPCNSGEFIVTLTNGKEVPASRNYRHNLIPLLTRTL